MPQLRLKPAFRAQLRKLIDDPNGCVLDVDDALARKWIAEGKATEISTATQQLAGKRKRLQEHTSKL